MARGSEHEPTEFAVGRLLAQGEGWRALVRDLAARWPEADPLDLVMALVDAAAAIERMFAPGSHAQEGAVHGYRCAALLSLDIHAMNRLGMRCGRAADLAAYWQIDGYFLRL
ncbi:MAG: hypothetical protein Q8J98_13160 [Phaeovulum sp.]|uniref:hypothetical protein n=1 Tax=Phaeovulum sp. TaxID=2934796 RepID=UPI002730EC56|nr:hypothetical protein [Phaeovulum sp.]MDP2064038.1 hypothetical protein [Phaeovulum sp.]